MAQRVSRRDGTRFESYSIELDHLDLREILNGAYSFLESSAAIQIPVNKTLLWRTALLRLDTLKAHRIGEGGTSTVVCQYDGDVAVAVKRYKHTHSTTIERTRQLCIKEAVIMASLRHQNVLQLRGVVDVGPSQAGPAIITPFMQNGDLPSYLCRNRAANKRHLIAGIAHGLGYLKLNSIVHGDVKGANILVDDNGSPRICDFGLAYYQVDDSWCTLSSEHPLPEGTHCHYSGAGTLRYMSPERLNPGSNLSARATFASDIFSYGMVIYEVYDERMPYHTLTKAGQIIKAIVEGARPMMATPGSIPDDVWHTAETCWTSHPSDRPTIEEIVSLLSTSKNS